MEKRELIQHSVRESMRQSDYTGMWVIAPRVGKSKIIIDAVGSGKWNNWDIVIATPREDINQTWLWQFAEWGNNVNEVPLPICFASLKKIKTRPKLLIIDECQMLSPAQADTIKRIDPERLMFVTGTANQYTRGFIKYWFGIDPTMEYTIDEAIRDGIIANFHVYIVKVPMKVGKKISANVGGTWMKITERQAYDYYTSMFDQLKIQERLNPDVGVIKEMFARKRAEVIYDGVEKIAVAKSIQERITERVLVFTARTKVADQLSPYSYHSKNKKEKNLQRFIDGYINTLGVVQMSDMGLTFPDLKHEIVHQLQSNSETSLQKFLRTCNLEDEGQEARIIVTVYKDTVDEGWARQATEGVPSDKITWLEIGELDGLIERLKLT